MASILLIEDDRAVRRLVRQTLREQGHQVIEAANGSEGVRLYRQTPADLIITDLMMPEKDGLEVIIDLRREYPKVKIIAISGGGRYGHEDYLKTARMLGARRTIEKPFGATALLRAVAEVLEGP